MFYADFGGCPSSRRALLRGYGENVPSDAFGIEERDA